MHRDLKLYVWDHILCDHTCGMIVILAENRKKALSLLRKKDKNAWEIITGKAEWYKGSESDLEPQVIEDPVAIVRYGSS